MTLEKQLEVLAEIGVTLNEGVTIEDLTAFADRAELEANPFSQDLIAAVGSEVEREPFTPKADRIWMCDYERIEDHGDYKSILERLEVMAGSALKLSNITDYVDVEKKKAWVEFVYNGKHIRWKAKVDDDWMDPYIVVKYDDLLGKARSPGRIYSNHTDFGQVALFAFFESEQAKKFNAIGSTKVATIQSQK